VAPSTGCPDCPGEPFDVAVGADATAIVVGWLHVRSSKQVSQGGGRVVRFCDWLSQVLPWECTQKSKKLLEPRWPAASYLSREGWKCFACRMPRSWRVGSLVSPDLTKSARLQPTAQPTPQTVAQPSLQRKIDLVQHNLGHGKPGSGVRFGSPPLGLVFFQLSFQ